MLKRVFDPKRQYRVVLYVRMSSDNQNRRSPEQQIQEINRRLQALGYRWSIVATYRDDAISGKYLRKRKGYQKMLRDPAKTGTVAADLILVDTLERLGRVEELPTIRKELFERDGVLVLTADSNFADPNTPQGKALGMVESMRATEDGRDQGAQRLARQTGRRRAEALARRPAAVRVQAQERPEVGSRSRGGRLLPPGSPPRDAGNHRTAFETAEKTGHGSTRLAKALNRDPRIADEFKPFQPETIGYWLDSTIYYGDLTWGQNCTGVVDDTRVVERNAPAEVLGMCGSSASRWSRASGGTMSRRFARRADDGRFEPAGKSPRPAANRSKPRPPA